jgi:small GTP-binding protein
MEERTNEKQPLNDLKSTSKKANNNENELSKYKNNNQIELAPLNSSNKNQISQTHINSSDSGKDKDKEKYSKQAMYIKINYDYTFKIIVLGDSGVGKSCFVNRAIHDKFSNNLENTMGFEFFNMFVKVDEKSVKLQIWDTCGQEVYQSLVSSFYRDTDLAFLVYSVNNKQTFNNLTKWIVDIKQKSRDCFIYLIGNKCDLGEMKVTEKEVSDLLNTYDINGHTVVSAKEGYNCKETFLNITEFLLEEVEKLDTVESTCDANSNFRKRHSGLSSFKKDQTSIKMNEKPSNKCMSLCSC